MSEDKEEIDLGRRWFVAGVGALPALGVTLPGASAGSSLSAAEALKLTESGMHDLQKANAYMQMATNANAAPGVQGVYSASRAAQINGFLQRASQAFAQVEQGIGKSSSQIIELVLQSEDNRYATGRDFIQRILAKNGVTYSAPEGSGQIIQALRNIDAQIGGIEQRAVSDGLYSAMKELHRSQTAHFYRADSFACKVSRKMPVDLERMMRVDGLNNNSLRKLAQTRGVNVDELREELAQESEKAPATEVEGATHSSTEKVSIEIRENPHAEKIPEFWQIKWSDAEGRLATKTIETACEFIDDLKTFRTASAFYIVPAKTIERDERGKPVTKIAVAGINNISQDARLFVEKIAELYTDAPECKPLQTEPQTAMDISS